MSSHTLKIDENIDKIKTSIKLNHTRPSYILIVQTPIYSVMKDRSEDGEADKMILAFSFMQKFKVFESFK